MVYSEDALSSKILPFQIEQTTAQRFLTQLVIKPRIFFLYFMRKQSAYIIYSNCIFELLSDLPSLLEKVGAKPNLLQMRFMRIFAQNLLYRHSSPWIFVNTQPHQTETSPAQQSHPLEFFRKPFPEFAVFLSR